MRCPSLESGGKRKGEECVFSVGVSEVVSEGDGESSKGCEGSRASRKWWEEVTTAKVVKNRFKFVANRRKSASLA